MTSLYGGRGLLGSSTIAAMLLKAQRLTRSCFPFHPVRDYIRGLSLEPEALHFNKKTQVLRLLPHFEVLKRQLPLQI